MTMPVGELAAGLMFGVGLEWGQAAQEQEMVERAGLCPVGLGGRCLC